jgi:hypothetical protein
LDFIAMLANRLTLPERKASPSNREQHKWYLKAPEKKLLGGIARSFGLPRNLNHLRWHSACFISP